MAEAIKNLFGRNRNKERSSSDDHSEEHSSEHESSSSGQQAGPKSDGSADDSPYLHNSEYARGRRQLMELIRSLRELGADQILDIPKIVVIGKQSAGKSSLVEAVTGISMPRDAGMCTRCPMECTILTAPQWSCVVKLRKYDEDIAFSPELRHKDEVDIWIRRAQAALLCPHVESNTFAQKTREELKELTNPTNNQDVLTITGNKVVIDIFDPKGADLSFVDLPGLVEFLSWEGPEKSKESIKLIRDLTVTNISSPSTIILVTVPANDDLENQKAMQLARDADPEGARTICVVTKPDAIETGATDRRDQWRRAFEGDENHLTLGYYCVRLPGEAERNRQLNAQQLHQLASTFFKTNSPWKDLQCQDRLGVQNLVNDISRLLIQVLHAALPKLREQVNELLTDCLGKIAKLGPERSSMDFVAEIMARVSEFCKYMQNTVYGRSEDKSFVHQWREAFRVLRLDIRTTAPDFRPYELPEEHARPQDPPFQVQDDRRCNEHDSKYIPSTRSQHSASTRSLEQEVVSVEHLGPDSRVAAIGLVDVRDMIKLNTAWELYPHLPYQVKVDLIQKFVVQWHSPSTKCFNRVETIVERAIAAGISAHFGSFPKLTDLMRGFMHERLTERIKASIAELAAVLECEERQPFLTQDGDSLVTLQRDWYAYYRSLWSHAQPRYDRSNYHVSEALKHLNLAGYTTVDEHSLVLLIHGSEYDVELQVMAFVRSYFQIAYKRVTDVVPGTIGRDFLQRFVDDLRAYLLMKLELSSPTALQRLQELFAEAPEITQRRARLRSQRQKLEDIKTRLDNYRV